MPSGRQPSPLLVLVPGFTQHNRSAEFDILKNFCRDHGFSFLIMNPPQHGQVYDYERTFDWGENETDDLRILLDSLRIWEKHSEIHLLGFSIGGKVVLKFAAANAESGGISSVIAVAAPYRVGDINIRLSTDVRVLNEAVRSKSRALRRSSFGRLARMLFCGMPHALAINRATPANEIPSIQTPTLLIHAGDDWLTKSYHSARLFRRAGAGQQMAFVAIESGLHAEDLLTRDEITRDTLLNLIASWLRFSGQPDLPQEKAVFDAGFREFAAQTVSAERRRPGESISEVSTPTLYDFSTDEWQSAADLNHSLLTVNSFLSFNRGQRAAHYLTLGSTRLDGPLPHRFRLGVSFHHDDFGELSAGRGEVSFYYPFGTAIWLRRLTYSHGLDSGEAKWRVGADLALLILDFQMRHGRLLAFSGNDFQLAFNCPIYSTASGSRFFGMTYSHFLSSVPAASFQSTFKFYLTMGPEVPLAGARWRATLQYEQDGINFFNTSRIWGLGLAVNFAEE